MKLTRKGDGAPRPGIWHSLDCRWLFVRTTKGHWLVDSYVVSGSAKEFVTRKHLLAKQGIYLTPFRLLREAKQAVDLALEGCVE